MTYLSGRLLLVLVLTVPMPGMLRAQGMPFHLPTALPLPLAEASIRGFVRHEAFSATDRAGALLDASADVIPLMVPYGIRRGTTVTAMLPMQRRRLVTPEGRRSETGVGDVSVQVKQELLAADPVGGNRRVAVFVTATAPTGRTGSGEQPLPPPLRLGSGATSLRSELVYSHVQGRWGAHAALGYTIAVGSRLETRPGERVTYGLALGYRLRPTRYATLKERTWAGYLEVSGSHERRAHGEAGRVEGTGGDLLMLAPGLQTILRRDLLLEVSFQVPVLRHLRDSALQPSWSWSFGARYFLDLFGG